MSLLNREQLFADYRVAKIVHDSLQFFSERKEIRVFAYVIMPDHFHIVLELNAPLILPTWVRRFKTFTAHEIAGGKSIWMTSCWSELVVTEDFFYQKLEYIHKNPVRAGLCEQDEAYHWSSAREYLSGKFELIRPF